MCTGIQPTQGQTQIEEGACKESGETVNSKEAGATQEKPVTVSTCVGEESKDRSENSCSG